MRNKITAAFKRQNITSSRRFVVGVAALGVAGLALSACSDSGSVGKLDPFAGTGSPYYSGRGEIPKGGGRRQIGKPYTVAGRKFYPKADPNYNKKGMASWYGPKFNKRKTSNGEWFDMDYRSAAHATLPLPSYAKVKNLENGREMVVRINDRGPFVGTRIIDLSKKSAEILGYKNKGKTHVQVTYLGPAPLNDKGQHLDAMNKALYAGTPTRQLIARADAMSGGGTTQMASAQQPRTQIAAVADTPGAYYVQAGSFSVRDNAERLSTQLSDIANTKVSPKDNGNGRFYQVRLGPWENAGSAHTALQRVVDAGYGDARLVTGE